MKKNYMRRWNAFGTCACAKTESKTLSPSGQPRVAKSVLFPKSNLPTTNQNFTGARKGWPERAIRCITRCVRTSHISPPSPLSPRTFRPRCRARYEFSLTLFLKRPQWTSWTESSSQAGGDARVNSVSRNPYLARQRVRQQGSAKPAHSLRVLIKCKRMTENHMRWGNAFENKSCPKVWLRHETSKTSGIPNMHLNVESIKHKKNPIEVEGCLMKQQRRNVSATVFAPN